MGKRSKENILETNRQAAEARVVLDQCMGDRFVYILLVIPLENKRVDHPPEIVTSIEDHGAVGSILSWVGKSFNRYRYSTRPMDR